MTSRGVIAAGHAVTADAGAAILRDGGNAADAAIAAIAMACVCEPVLCSPGGGGFAMVRDVDGSVRVLDAFVQTPRRRAHGLDDGAHDVSADFGTAQQGFRIGPATSATPGLFDGLARLAAEHGTLPLPDLFAPAAEAARRGIEITPFQQHLLQVVRPIVTATEPAARLFAPGGRLLTAGAVFRNPGLADALEELARAGFAAGDVGRAVVAQQSGRGHLTRSDLDAYTTVERTPHTIELGGARIHLNPLPAAGGMLVGHTLAQLGPRTTATAFARAVAATGRARRDLAGDLAALAGLPLRRRGTTHVSVVDAAGVACAITASNGEGNGELVDGFGFMLNNVLGEDDVNPDGDEWPTDTRLSSMMCPTIVEHPDGGLTALGSGGSARIRSAISRVVAALCLDGTELADAVDAPRLHVTDGHLTDGHLTDGHLDVEVGLDEHEVDELLGVFADHLVWPAPDLFFGGVHAVHRHADGRLVGHGDPRRSGAAVVMNGDRPARLGAG